MEIRAAVLDAMGATPPYASSKPLAIENLPVINGSRPRPMPMALGHEAAGIVEEVEPTIGGGDNLKPGDNVVFVFVPSCGHCEPCTEGRPALCEPGAAANGAGTLLSGARRLQRQDGTPVNHHLGVSDSLSTPQFPDVHW